MLPSPRSGADLPLVASAITPPSSLSGNPPSTMRANWNAWAQRTPPGRSERRDLAVLKLEDCLQRNGTELTLAGLGLTEPPPDIPPCVTMLDISDNEIQSIDTSPLHDGLHILIISLNLGLAALPAILPDSLKVLEAADCNLEILPDPWICALEELTVRGNPGLTSLPETLPASLRLINVSYCSLLELPQRLPANLTTFVASKNFISNPSDILMNLDCASFVDLRRNPLTAAARDRWQALMSEEHYTGPRLHFDRADIYIAPRYGESEAMATGDGRDHDEPGIDAVINPADALSGSPRSNWPYVSAPLPAVPLFGLEQETARSLQDIMAVWYPLADQAEAIATWSRFECDAECNQFFRFLDRLCSSINAQSAEFRQHIAQWLNELSQPQAQALRERCFSLAFDASTSCEDRATLTLIQMQQVRIAFDVEQGRYDDMLPALIDCGRSMFRQETLTGIACNYLLRQKNSADADEIDVYLAFLIKLREPLDLRILPQQMAFFMVSEITPAQIAATEQDVKWEENANFADWLCDWPPWNAALARLDPSRCQAAQQALNDALDSFDERLAQMLASCGLPADSDTERSAGRVLLEQLTLENKSALTQQCLAARQLQHLLDPVWPQ